MEFTLPNMATRSYRSELRTRQAETTRRKIITAAKTLFSRHGIDQVTTAQIAARAKVGVSTVYALFGSKEGLLSGLMEDALFGARFRAAWSRLEGLTDPVRLVEETAGVARAIWSGETAELGLLRGASAFTPDLRALEDEFEQRRYEMQRGRLVQLQRAGLLAPGLTLTDARRLMWTLTSRETWRMLVDVGGWSPARYEKWLARTLVQQLVKA